MADYAITFARSARRELETLDASVVRSRFLSAVEQTAERISIHPEAGAPLGSEFRKRIVPGFPYNIIYRVWEDYIYLVAVAHHHRRPG